MSKKNKSAVSFENLFFKILPRRILYMRYPFGHLYGRTYSLISRTDKVELIATEFFQQSCNCLGHLEQHTKSCKSYLVGKYLYFRLKNDHFYA